MNIEPLTKDAFAPFGTFISAKETQNKKCFDGFDYIGNIAVAPLWERTSLSLLQPKRRELVLTKMEAHKNTVELCIAIENDCILFVATDKEGKPDTSNIHAFYLCCGDTVAYDKGIWHWVPFPVEDESCKQLILYKDNTGNEDFYSYELLKPLRIEKE